MLFRVLEAQRQRLQGTAAQYRPEQLSYRAVFLDRVAQSLARVNDVVVSSPFFQAHQNAGSFQLRDQTKRCALGNADALCNIAQSGIRILGKTDENVSIVTEEAPADVGGLLSLLIPGHSTNIRQKKPDNNVLYFGIQYAVNLTVLVLPSHAVLLD